MSSDNSDLRPVRGALEELDAAREKARLRLRLLSMDANQRRHELQTSLATLEHEVEHGLNRAVSVATSKARELARAANHFLGRHFSSRAELKAPVSSIMSPQPKHCAPEDSLNRAAQILWETDCGFVPVVGADGKLVGVISDRDLCMACYLKGSSLLASSVGPAMSRRVYACAPDHPIEHALSLMAAHQIRRVPVVEHDGTLVGIVALADIARYVHALPGDALAAHAALGVTLASISERRGAQGSSEAHAAE
jgi:CBS domain-containing protein